MKSTILTLLILPFVLISCTSVITKHDCKKDMTAFGLEHGKLGLAKLTDEIRSVCQSKDQTVDLEKYETGFNMGWSSFCSPFNGYELGRKGDAYKSFCPAEKESLFHKKFLIGKSVYEKKDQVVEFEDKIKELKYDIDNNNNSSSTKDELAKNQEYLRILKREIQALEQEGVNPVSSNPL